MTQLATALFQAFVRMEFKRRQLYGGAITTDVPSKYYDVSEVRQVPDTQEVFQEREGVHNLIVDILEHVEHIKEPLEAARYHLEDYIDGDKNATVWNIESVSLPKLENVSAVQLLATPEANEGKSTAIFLVLVRLPKHGTDIVITANLHDISTSGATDYDSLFHGPTKVAFQEGKAILQQVINTLNIKDYGLFHPE